MKKLILLLATGVVATSAFAQSSVVRVDNSGAANIETREGMPIKQTGSRAANTNTANKGTNGGSRIYNYVEYLGVLSQDVFNNGIAPYMWNKPDMYGIYQGTSGLERDTINMSSYGMVLMPWYKDFNDGSYPGNPIGIKSTDAYTVDSIYVYGFYGRNPAKTGIDTLRFRFTYSVPGTYAANNLGNYYFSGQQANYNVDTVRFAALFHDSVANVAAKSTFSKDLYLNAASVNDTDASGTNMFKIAVNQSIPAGNLVAVSVTFKSGEAYTPWDTVYRGSVNPTVPFKYGMFRPLIYEQTDAQYPTYTGGSFAAGAANWNAGAFKFLPVTNGYNGFYIPTWAFVKESGYEWPYIDFKLTCATCKTVQQIAGVQTASNNIASVNAYPNPATEMLKVPVTLSNAANVTVSLVNMMGQTMTSVELGNVKAGVQAVAEINTATIPAGVYMYVVNADGQTASGRVVVAH